MSDELTAKEMQSRGGKATVAKYSKEERLKWASHGGQTTKERHGREYYQELNRKSYESKRRKKLLKEQNQA